MNPFDFAAGLLAGVGIAAGLYLLLWWMATRRRSVGGRTVEARTLADNIAPVEGATLPTEMAADAPVPTSVIPNSTPESESVPPQPDAPTPPRTGSAPTPKGTLRLSQRVILHVYSQGRWPPGEVAPAGLCQAGMVEALGIPQAGLAAVLRRLEAAGILEGERAHVRGRDRRLKVYRLSTRGLDLAQELRRRPRSKGGP
ncbi:MAG: hypothetical protein L3K18_02295 [Thermoplasmata archaeon]|nr:hypothetical protein [Thermoplasmata archaeon]MCI4355961.1 hypothetical protein [Thermoplasmata archaeon]